MIGATSSPGPSLSGVALLLVGHGSHRSADSSSPVRLLARRIREAGWFREVRVGFWKEDPHLSRALDLVETPEVVVVPIFTSAGYFTDRVVPRELGLEGPITLSRGRTIRYARPVGSHPLMAAIVLERASEAAPLSVAEEKAATLVVIGHGTEAHPASGDATRALAERVRDSGRYGRVEVAFLDQEPRLESVVAGLEGTVVLVPFFVSDGWHAGTTIPESLGAAGASLAGGPPPRAPDARRTLRYSKAVGTHPGLAEVVSDLASEALGWDVPAGDAPEGGRGPASHVSPEEVDQARFAFLRWVSEGGMEGRAFLQTVVRASREGGFEIRHWADRDRGSADLAVVAGVEGAADLAALTAEGVHRPLTTAPDLPAGWRIPRLGLDEVWEAYAHLYGTAAVHLGLARRGRLRVVPFEEAAGRQTGLYREVASLGGEGAARVAQSCCAHSRCLRAPAWVSAVGEGASAPPDPAPGVPLGEAVPCPEPCSVFMASALDSIRRPG